MRKNTILVSEFQRLDQKLATFSEAISALVGALTDNNFDSPFFVNSISGSEWNIVFGLHRLIQSSPGVSNRISGNNVIAFNLEPLFDVATSVHHLEYIDLLKRIRVIDYSQNNVDLLKRHGNSNVFRFRFGYTPMSPHSFPKRSDVLTFYGQMSERRELVLERIRRKGVLVNIVNGVWGFDRDYQVSTSKAILNISRSDASFLEVYRIWHSLCLGAPVISEFGKDPTLSREWSKYVHFTNDIAVCCSSHELNIVCPSLYKEETSFGSEVKRLAEWVVSG